MSRRTRTLGGSVLALAGLASLYTCHADGPPSAPEGGVTPPPAPALDVAPPGAVTVVAVGDIASCSTNRDEQTAALVDGIDGIVITLGDAAYTAGSAAQYADCYEPTWGRHKARTYPVPGDRDYSTSNAAGYFGYFGAAAGDPAKGYYSFDAGAWHVVVLNTNIGTRATSAQIQWLVQDLAERGKPCTMAVFHKPRFSSAKDHVNEFEELYDALYAGGVDVVLSAHYMVYERFAKQRPDGTLDPENGFRQFVVGTGGAGYSPWKTQRENEEAQARQIWGVLKLTLTSSGYSWEFVSTAEQPYSDSGTDACSGASGPPPGGDPGELVARPGSGYEADEGSAVQFDGSASSDGGHPPLAYLWTFGDGTTGSGATPTHVYAASGTRTVSLRVVNAAGDTSETATTTATIANVAPTVDAGGDVQIVAGGTVSLSATFTDPGGSTDSPWTYVVDWGNGTTSSGTKSGSPTPITGSRTYSTPGTYTIRVSVTDKDGATGVDEKRVTVATGVSQVIVAVGDIASCTSTHDEAVAAIVDNIPGPIISIGDNAYEDASHEDYANCFEPSWGRHKSRMWVQLGNHEYYTGSADPTHDYFGARAGPRGKGFYSFDIGDWHIIVLNDNKAFVPYKPGSEQDQWLRADLAANTKLCTMAVFHQPYYYSSNSSTTRYKGLESVVQTLYDAGVDVLLTGHRHLYERFAKQDPKANRDDARGIRQFTVGTGGRGYSTFDVIAPNSEARMTKVYGVLKMTLHPDRYEWQFLSTPYRPFSDSGSDTCH